MSPKSDQHQFSPNNINVSSREYDMRMNTENGHLVTRGKILSTDLFNWSQILSTDSLMECMEVTQKNLLVDIGAKGVRVKWYTSGGSRRGLKILWVTRKWYGKSDFFLLLTTNKSTTTWVYRNLLPELYTAINCLTVSIQTEALLTDFFLLFHNSKKVSAN